MKEADSDEPFVAESDAETGSHTVLIVDCSGSMRKGDVPGYPSRTAAVYDCLARDFVEPQRAALCQSENSKNRHVVSLIEMSNEATIVFSRQPIGEDLKSRLSEQAEQGSVSTLSSPGGPKATVTKTW
jgi:hypothetical protein